MLQDHSERIIGIFEGTSDGPLILVVGALHGNEPAGVHALELLFEQLEKERRDTPGFQFRGTLVGIIGNLQGYRLRQRFLEQDLNRLWIKDFVDAARVSKPETLKAETLEAKQLAACISEVLQSYQTTRTIFLDLHTTSAEGGIFSIPTNEGESLKLAEHLGAPAILGLHGSIQGDLMGYATQGGFSSAESTSGTTPLPVCVAFEAGQHESPQSVTRSAIAVIRCLRWMHCIAQDVLVEFATRLSLPFMSFVPPVVRFRYAHHIEVADEFKMRPGYVNFQPIQAGEHLADDVRGPVLSPDNGLILMPLYQAKGSDGFFIVQ